MPPKNNKPFWFYNQGNKKNVTESENNGPEYTPDNINNDDEIDAWLLGEQMQAEQQHPHRLVRRHDEEEPQRRVRRYVAPDNNQQQQQQQQQNNPPQQQQQQKNNPPQQQQQQQQPRLAYRQVRNEGNYPRGNYRLQSGHLSRAVSWMFVIFLDEENEHAVNNVDYRPVIPPQMMMGPTFSLTYLRFQLERGNNGMPEIGNRLHIQGYMEFNERVTAPAICEYMRWTVENGWNMNDIWLAPRNGPRETALNYVWKDETCVNPATRFEQGTPRPETAATVGAKVREMIREGKTADDIAEALPDVALRCGNSIKLQIDAHTKAIPRSARYVRVFVLWGDTGTGKTSYVYKKHGYEEVYSKITSKYFDGYDPQRHKVLLLDEMVGAGEIGIKDLLTYLDVHPLIVEVKGASTYAAWTHVYITSNKPPSQWFPHCSKRHLEALYRRFEGGGIIKFVDSTKMEDHLQELRSAPPEYKKDHENVVEVDVAELKRKARERLPGAQDS